MLSILFVSLLSSPTVVLMMLQRLQSLHVFLGCYYAKLPLEVIENGVAGNSGVVICIIMCILKVFLIHFLCCRCCRVFLLAIHCPRCCVFGSRLLD